VLALRRLRSGGACARWLVILGGTVGGIVAPGEGLFVLGRLVRQLWVLEVYMIRSMICLELVMARSRGSAAALDDLVALGWRLCGLRLPLHLLLKVEVENRHLPRPRSILCWLTISATRVAGQKLGTRLALGRLFI